MNYGQLKTAVLSDSHRPDLSSEVARFVREGEGMIRRELRAYELSTTLDETDRVSEGVYTLPSTLLEVRAVYTEDAPAGAEQVSLAAIRRRDASGSVLQYAVRGNQIEFRGVPAEDEEIELLYLGWPAALAVDADTNDLLTLHEVIYKSSALFSLYQHTQDVELAQGQLDVFMDAIEKLNEANGRKQGGAVVAGAYYFGCGGGY